ncbi:MAG: YdeI/OmpD-associated family protein [Dehalococcoidia bacterium]
MPLTSPLQPRYHRGITDAPARPRRPRYPIPDAVREALAARRPVEAYEARPAYQRNDYLGWIVLGQRPATREKGSTKRSTNSPPAMST